MKKIFLLFATVCAFAACDPVHEDISNGGHITVDELRAMTTVTLSKYTNGNNGNLVTCSTSAPVNATWSISGKDFIGNYATKKLKLDRNDKGDFVETKHDIVLKALCADGTLLIDTFKVTCQEITDTLNKFYIYGDPSNVEQKPFEYVATGDASPGRFSDNEGKYFPYLSDAIYFGKKTLVFEITDVKEGDHIWGGAHGPAELRVMTGWWDPVFADGLQPKVGLWELPITDDMAKACAKGGDNRDLDILMTRGSITIKSVFYEE